MAERERPSRGVRITLPAGPATALTELLTERRSTKHLAASSLALDQVAGLLRHAAGVDGAGRATYASARARHLVAVTLVAGEVVGLRPGAYRYAGEEHALRTGTLGDHRPALAAATIDADWLGQAPAILVLSADLDAADEFFVELGPGRGERFAWLEAGLITQNAYLWAAAEGVGTAFIGGLDQAGLPAAARAVVPATHTVLGLLPVGWPASQPVRGPRAGALSR